MVPHSPADKEQRTTGERDRTTQGSSGGKIKPQNLWLYKPMGVARVGETPSLIGESIGGAHGALEHTQAHPPGNQYQHSALKGTIEGAESGVRAKQAALVPLLPLPHMQHHNEVKWVALPWRTPKAPPLTNVTGAPG